MTRQELYDEYAKLNPGLDDPDVADQVIDYMIDKFNLTDFCQMDERLIDTDAVYVCVIGPRCPGRKLSEQLYKAYREVLYREVLDEE